MIQVTYSVPGEPRGKGRPKFARRGNFVKTYTDAKTASYEDQIRFYALKAMGDSKAIQGAVRVLISICMAVPKSYSQKRREACLNGSDKPLKKPDWDNVAKSICDAMNGIVYGDDTQIVEAHVTKKYAEQSKVIVLVQEV
jgi:Holliday junction resolvase RusA-like endonuclease